MLMNIRTHAFNVQAPGKGSLVALVEREKIVLPTQRGSLAVMDQEGNWEMSPGPMQDGISRDHTITQKGRNLVVDGQRYKTKLHPAGQNAEGEKVSLYTAEQAKMGLGGRMAAGFGLAILGIMSGAACKGSPAGPDLPEPTTFYISVYDHMKPGVQKTLTKEGMTNSAIMIQYSDVAIGDVSTQLMVAREPNIGKRLGYTTNGAMSVATGNSQNIDIYLFSGGLENNMQEIMGQGPVLVAGRNSNWYRKNFDGYTPNNEFQAEWDHAFNEVDNALNNPFPVGSCSPQGGNWSYGYGSSPGGGGDKDYSKKAIWSDSKSLHEKSYTIIRANLEELWEALGRINNIGGGASINIIANGTSLNQTGHNLARFYMLMAE